MDFFNRDNETAASELITAAEARARLRARAGELKREQSGTNEHLTARPQRLRWSGRNSS